MLQRLRYLRAATRHFRLKAKTTSSRALAKKKSSETICAVFKAAKIKKISSPKYIYKETLAIWFLFGYAVY